MRSGIDPGLNELTQSSLRSRRRGAAAAWVPAPGDQIVVRNVLVQEREVTAAVAFGILQLGADLACRFSLPGHLDRSQAPSRVTRDAFVSGRRFQQRIVRLRVARRTLGPWPACPGFAALDGGNMAV